jgi:hypothetical protein
MNMKLRSARGCASVWAELSPTDDFLLGTLKEKEPVFVIERCSKPHNDTLKVLTRFGVGYVYEARLDA